MTQETIPEDEKAWETAKQEAIAAVAPTDVPDQAATRGRVERFEADPIPGGAWPSEKARYLMERIAEGKPIDWSREDIARFDERERYCLHRALSNSGYETTYDPDMDCYSAIRKPTP